MSFLPRRLSSDKIYPGIQFAELKKTALLSTLLPIWQFNYFHAVNRDAGPVYTVPQAPSCAVPINPKSAARGREGYAVNRDAAPVYRVPRESCAVPLEPKNATLDLEGYPNSEVSFLENLQKSGQKSNLENLQKSGHKSTSLEPFDEFGWLAEKLRNINQTAG